MRCSAGGAPLADSSSVSIKGVQHLSQSHFGEEPACDGDFIIRETIFPVAPPPRLS